MDNEKEIGIVGFASFCVGSGLLIFVLYLVYLLTQDPPFLYVEKMIYLPYPERYFTNILTDVISLASLAIMGGASGKIVSKSIKLFKSSKS